MTAERPRRPSGPLRLGALGIALLGVVQLGFGLFAAPGLAFAVISADVGPWVQLGRFGLVVLIFGGLSTGLGMMSLAVAAGLVLDQRWAWYAGVLLGFLYMPSGCLPAGFALLLILLEPGCRAYFLWNPDQLYTDGVDRHV